MYRSPNSLQDNNSELFTLFDEICKKPGYKLFIGDFNFPNITWTTGQTNSSLEGKFMDTLRKYFLEQHVSSPTRARGQATPHLLDLVITDELFVHNIDYTAPIGKSDHCTLLISCNFTPLQNSSLDKYAFSKGDYAGLCNSLRKVEWNDLLQRYSHNIDDMWLALKCELDNRINKFIPKMKNFAQFRKESWSRPLDQQVRAKIRKKHRLWTRYMETRDDKIFKKYKSARNAVSREIKKIVRNEQQDVASQCKDNPKKFWNYINSKRKTKSSVGDLITTDIHGNTVIAYSNEEKANALGNQYSNVFTKSDDLLHSNFVLDTKLELHNLSKVQFSKQCILSKLSQLNTSKSPGPDGFHPRVLFEIRNELLEPLEILFTASFATGQIPDDWRTANITAIYKKGSKTDPSNYRPISLTSIICKIMESIIRDDILNYFLDNGLFSKTQYGFIRGRSTVLQLLKIMDDWTYILDQGKQIDAIYTDFEKAFDKVSHRGLLIKLKAYNICAELLSWIQAFLCNRKQRVKVHGSFSKWYCVESGIPQGSILGPLLFLIYINDLPDICSNLPDSIKIYVFADDTKVYNTITSDMNQNDLQTVIDKIKDWCDRWLLPLNVSKCCHMSYKDKINTDYHICDSNTINTIQKVEYHKDLGVLFDLQLTFKDHIQQKINKAYSIIGLIKRNFIHMNSNTFVLLYKALVRPHVEYANSVWSPYRKSDILAIEKIQKRATKLVISLKKLSYKDRLMQLNLHTLKYRRIRGDMIEVYKIIRQIYDSSVAPNLQLGNTGVTRGNKYKLLNHTFRSNLRKYCFSARVVNTWNSLPDYVVDVDTVDIFKSRLDRYWKDQDVMFDCDADLTGTGNRSEYELESD